jgi:hypothetical protein
MRLKKLTLCYAKWTFRSTEEVDFMPFKVDFEMCLKQSTLCHEEETL